MIKRKFVFAHINVATEYGKLSSCNRLKVGAVIVKGDTPIAIGYNGTKPGQDNCCEGADGKTLPTVRHAEVNALNKLWTTTESAKGAVVFVTHAPCLECAQDLFNAGITGVYFRWHYRDESGLEWLLHKGVEVYKVLPDIDTIKRLSLRYNTQVDPYREIAYDTVTETKAINEEAARAAGPVEWHNLEVHEATDLQWEILGEILAGADIHAGDGGYREVPLSEYVPNPEWEKRLAEDGLPAKGFIPLNEGGVKFGPWPFPKTNNESGTKNTKPWNGPGSNSKVRPKPGSGEGCSCS